MKHWQIILGYENMSNHAKMRMGTTKCMGNPKWTVFPQISKAMGHERVQFTLVVLLSRFTSAANFLRADPGAKRRKVGLFQHQLPSLFQTFPKRIRPLIKLKNSFSTNFQGTGPWEGPVHFTRFVLRVHKCSKLFQSWSWSQGEKETPSTKATFSFSFSLPFSVPFSFPFSFSFSNPFSFCFSFSFPFSFSFSYPFSFSCSSSSSLSLSFYRSLSFFFHFLPLIACFIKKKG